MQVQLFCFLLILSFFSSTLYSQSNFSVDAYQQFLQSNQDLSYQEVQDQFKSANTYYKGLEHGTDLFEYLYYDSVIIKYHLTSQELDLLKQNQFVVSERLNFNCFGHAFHDIYIKDLPVFITTDAILHALHASYDQILIDIELSILKSNLATLLNELYHSYPQLVNKYGKNQALLEVLKDVDLYITMAKSLLDGIKGSPQYTGQEQIDEMWDAIQQEQLVSKPLFSERPRKLDFSQFTVRGHYNNDYLRDYFKAIMWLGRMDFMLTPPPENPWEEPWTRVEIRRMNLGAFMLNELINLTDVRSLLNQNNEIINFMVGESDNLTPQELSDLLNDMGLSSADQLLDDPTYDAFQTELEESNAAEQKILSQFMMMDPFNFEPGKLPVSFRLMGQRFIIDSYIFFNVVFDRIVYEDNKIWRPLPDPLDAMFVLGNDDALPLLKEELELYKYGSQLAALRYLVDSYDAEFWEASLYNVWLQAIRWLNPPENRTHFPFFMKTAAWQQEKLNTQLASWSQLRHDNLLYAKQSYTGATGCSFPHSYIEPFPEFYNQIAAFADKALAYFEQFADDSYEIFMIKSYFPRLKSVMLKLESIAQKEVSHQPLNSEEITWLKEMLFEGAVSGEPPFTGWYAELYYHMDDAAMGDYVIADVHTQPTDQAGNVVGHVLHVGVGKINLGVFLAESPATNYTPTAFVGPVMSYYEKLTNDFDRLTDERWTTMVDAGEVPIRPDWVNIYLADGKGTRLKAGRELPSVVYTGQGEEPPQNPSQYKLYQNYPNPFNPVTTITYELGSAAHVQLSVFNVLGKKVATLVNTSQMAGSQAVDFNGSHLSSGIYFCRIQACTYSDVIKMMLVR